MAPPLSRRSLFPSKHNKSHAKRPFYPSYSSSSSSLSRKPERSFTLDLAMASSYCSRWHAILYVTLAAILVAVATTTIRSSIDSSSDTSSSSSSIRHVISVSASKTLRASGFSVTAALLQISPELFLSPAANSTTIFAIADSHFTSNASASLPPHLLRDLLKYHTSPIRVSVADVTVGTCLPTLYRNKSVAVTKIERRRDRTVQINRVPISHPNLFQEGPVTIHGVPAPFAAVDAEYDVIRVFDCENDTSSTVVSSAAEKLKKKKNKINRNSNSKPKKKEKTTSRNRSSSFEWARIVRLLSYKGFVSFAVGLHSALDGIVKDERLHNVTAVTIFVPPRLELGGRSSALPRQHHRHYQQAMLDKVVRIHIVRQRLTHEDLKALPARTLLKTMACGGRQLLEVTGNVSFVKEWVIEGARIVAPDAYVSESVVVHGISRAFQVNADLANT